MIGVVQALPVIDTTGRQVMQTPEDAAQMLRLRAAGLGIKTIARKMGCSKNTVRRYLRSGGWVAYKRPERQSVLHGLEPWLVERLQRHHGNADVVRQDLQREHSITVSLRTVERAVVPFRRELKAAQLATVRFETAPGEQLHDRTDRCQRVADLVGDARGQEAESGHLFLMEQLRLRLLQLAGPLGNAGFQVLVEHPEVVADPLEQQRERTGRPGHPGEQYQR